MLGHRSRSLEGGSLEHFFPSLVSLSLALLASLALGRVASRVGVPRVSAYLLVGLALGPHALLRLFDEGGAADLFLLGPASETPLQAVEQLAIGFILFGIGAEFRFETFRRIGTQAFVLSGAEIGLTGLLAAIAVYACSGDWRLAVVTPALAISSAPSATLVTLREIEAEGPVSRALILCVGHNNLAALIAFPLLLSLAFGGGNPLAATALALLALVGGGAIGVAAAVGLESIDGRRELVLVGILVVLSTLGLLHWVQPGSAGLGMLGCFGAGVAISNASPHADQLRRYVENTVYPLYVLFFIGAGRDLHVEALGGAGLLGLLFIVARGTGKILGARLGLRLAGLREDLPGGFGMGLWCHAGVALGLVATLEAAHPEATLELRNVVVASVVFFELIGPWLVRRTVVGAGEVKLANLVPRPEATGSNAFRWVWLEIRRNLGVLGGGEPAAEGGPSVRHAMRRRPAVLLESLAFERVLKALAETHADLLPVVDAEGRFKGIISYDEVKNALYDPALRALVIAEDLTTRVEDALDPDAPLPAALEIMDRRQVHSWPVVEGDQLLGMMRRSDAYALMRRGLSPKADRAGGTE
jgi:Kef-type K+ transport system membrane component KefB/CBS domain-containing protein